MSATRDLIAAALTVRDVIQRGSVPEVYAAVKDLRELCARAMSDVPEADFGNVPVSAAEVPMPEPVGWANWYPKGAHVIFGLSIHEPREVLDREQVAKMSDVRTYGDAREAAGYARGLEARLSPEKMRIAAAGWREFDFVEGLAGEAAMIDRICSAIYAALRGEVKP